ncbi:MAG: exodeoxyribonuclease VII large subunit [Patescibacteria group bacterium]|jgi:exodeoxyribonuclease VII large subunit
MQIYSVSEFVHGVNELLSGIPACVQGEVSNFHVTQNRFVWFDLKDEASYVSCFLLAFQLDQPLEDGMEIQVFGKPNLFVKSGKFHLRVNKIQAVGVGSLKQQYELLKAKLTKEGLFDPARKRTLPKFPQRIGLVTSSDAAAYTDVLRILNNRWAGYEVIHFPVNVQGNQAVSSIVEALQYINHEYANSLDVVILTRGGGSMEDLQAFNDESVVRAVFGLKVPIVTAIGHERDETLAEFAADQRAATPSNAAELVVPDKRDVLTQIHTMLNGQAQSLDHQYKHVSERVSTAVLVLSQHIKQYDQNVDQLLALLHSYNPKQILKRGYSITQFKNKVITKRAQVTLGDQIETIFQDGIIKSKVL